MVGSESEVVVVEVGAAVAVAGCSEDVGELWVDSAEGHLEVLHALPQLRPHDSVARLQLQHLVISLGLGQFFRHVDDLVEVPDHLMEIINDNCDYFGLDATHQLATHEQDGSQTIPVLASADLTPD